MSLDIAGDVSGVVRVKPPVVRAFKRIFAADYTAETVSRAISAAGAYTIGGYTWWAKGPPTWGDGAVDAGLGIQVGGGAWSANAAYDWQALFFPFDQISDYQFALPVTVAFRISTTTLDGSSYVSAGIRGCAKSATKMDATTTQAGIRLNGPSLQDYHEGNFGINPIGANRAAGDTGTVLCIEQMLSSRIYTSAQLAWTGSMPSEMPDLTTALNPVNSSPQVSDGTRVPGFYYARNQSAVKVARLTHLALYQPSAS